MQGAFAARFRILFGWPGLALLLGMVVCLSALFSSAAASAAVASAPAADPWAEGPQDQRRALPNDSRPPARREPVHLLPPRTADPAGVGMVRRVAVPDSRKVAALTFDLCELDTVTTGYDAAIINFLRAEGLPATLFMGGKWMRTHAARVRQLLAEPLFEVGNHAWSHGNFALLSAEGMRAQALWTQAQYELLREDVLAAARAAGRAAPAIPPVPALFRLPYGRCSPQALELLASLGFTVVQWDVVAESGGDNSAPAQALEVARRVRPGSILLFHANRVPHGSAALLRGVVAALRARGYSFVTVSELLRQGVAQRTTDGYFVVPGDNRALDARFGADGTGRHTPFTGR